MDLLEWEYKVREAGHGGGGNPGPREGQMVRKIKEDFDHRMNKLKGESEAQIQKLLEEGQILENWEGGLGGRGRQREGEILDYKN